MSKKRVFMKVGFAISVALAFFGCAKEQEAKPGVSQQDAQPSSPKTEVVQLVKTPEKAKLMPQILLELDADGNGLYDDTERKAMLDVLQAECSELEGIVFDADGDGKVTVVEQDAGRHPLSKLVPMHFLDNNKKIPWTIDLFSEWLMTAYFQDDVDPGPVAGNLARGLSKNIAAQANLTLQPQKLADKSGVAFAANSGQHFSMRGNRDGRWNYRWGLFTFRLDAESGSGNETILLDVNQGRGPSKSSPKILYSKADGLRIQYVGRGKGGLDARVMTTHAVEVDGKTWNVVVFGVRQGRMFVSVNGIPLETAEEQSGRFSSELAYDAKSFIGDKRATNMAWAYDAIVLGQTEISEAMVRKLSGWAAHRLGFQDRLPGGHTYRHARPVLDEEDFPHRYMHDEEKWASWGVQMKDPAITRVNAGGPRVEPTGFERVFFDDFRANRIGLSTSGEDDLWMAPGFNTAVGAGARLNLPGRQPNVYTHDADRKLQYLSLAKQGNTWFGSAFYSINDMGQGYTWDGAKVFRVRCKFPKTAEKELTRGLFPAFWSYGTEFLFWRTSNRIEADWFEFDGKNGWWYNGLATHFHYTNFKNTFVKQNKSYPSHKLYSGMLTEKQSGIPGGFFFWDGQFHTWEFVVDHDMTVVNVTIPDGKGGDRWVEVCRGPTVPTYLERLDLQINYALETKDGTPGDDVREDYIVDWVEVLQKTDAVETVPEPFAARPMLTGRAAVGGTLLCQANVVGITDLRYYWFADGYPLTYGADSTYVLTSAEAGKQVRCMVKAVGARDMPEAWTDSVKIGLGDDRVPSVQEAQPKVSHVINAMQTEMTFNSSAASGSEGLVKFNVSPSVTKGELRLWGEGAKKSEVLADPTNIGQGWDQKLQEGFLTVGAHTRMQEPRNQVGASTTDSFARYLGRMSGSTIPGTIIMAFRPTADWSNSHRRTLLGTGETTWATLRLWVPNESNKLTFDYERGGAPKAKSQVTVEHAWDVDTWYFVAISWKTGAEPLLYVREMAPLGPSASPAAMLGTLTTAAGYQREVPEGKNGLPFGGPLAIGAYYYNPGANGGTVDGAAAQIAYIRIDAEQSSYDMIESMFNDLGVSDEGLKIPSNK